MARRSAQPGSRSSSRTTGRALPPVQLGFRESLPAALLLLAAVASALLVVQSTHACRQLHAALQQLERERWALDEDYTRLLLQQGTVTAHRGIEQAAEQALQMHPPALDQRRVFVP